MKKYVVVVAGGKGLRMGSEIPKQFIELNGKAIILHTLEKFKKALPQAELFLVLPQKEVSRWKEISKRTDFADLKIAFGGETRFHSVKAGLSLISVPGIIAIHDAVRPLAAEETIKRAFKEAEKCGTAIPVVDLNDSLRKVNKEGTLAVDRAQYKIVQTPQCFSSDLLLQAYEQEFSNTFTDDASVVEASGETIHCVLGNDTNIKITTKKDLKIAQLLMKLEEKNK